MFYTFRQNNTGGSFIQDEQVGTWVIVEAHNAKMANALAESHGLYFDGYGDCPCCGNRWSDQWDDGDGKETPSMYDTPHTEYEVIWFDETCVIYYLDGRKENFAFESKKQWSASFRPNKPKPKERFNQ